MVYAALALGHMANKHKILCSFGWFMAINFVSSMLVSILIRSLSHMPAIQNLLYFPMDYSLAPLHAILWLTTLFVVLFGAVYFLLTNYVMSKRLNLE